MIEIVGYEIYNGKKSDRYSIRLLAKDTLELDTWREYLKIELKVKFIHLIYKQK